MNTLTEQLLEDLHESRHAICVFEDEEEPVAHKVTIISRTPEPPFYVFKGGTTRADYKRCEKGQHNYDPKTKICIHCKKEMSC